MLIWYILDLQQCLIAMANINFPVPKSRQLNPQRLIFDKFGECVKGR